MRRNPGRGPSLTQNIALMSHSSKPSIDSTHSARSTGGALSSSSTTSSPSAITILADDFKQRYAEVDIKNFPIPQLVSQAERLIKALGASNLDNVIEYESAKVQADKVLEAMLAHAENCGGENGKRFTATAICACVHEKRRNSPETLQALRVLALTLVTHFLFVCEYLIFGSIGSDQA